MAIRLFALFSFALSNVICLLKVRCSSSVIPTYLTCEVAFNSTPFSFTLKFGIWAGFSLWKIWWGGTRFPPHLGKLVGGENFADFRWGGKRDFTNLYDKNTNYDLLYALSAMKSYLTTILSWKKDIFWRICYVNAQIWPKMLALSLSRARFFRVNNCDFCLIY